MIKSYKAREVFSTPPCMRLYSTTMALMKLLFLVFELFFTSQEIISLRVTSPSLDPEYDITARINQINELFKVITNVSVHRLTKVLPYRRLKPDQAKYETENMHKIKPFGDKILFQDIKVGCDDYDSSLGSQIHWDLSNNTMRIFDSKLKIRINAYMDIQPEQPYSAFAVDILFARFSITAKEVSIDEHDKEIEIDIECATAEKFYVSFPDTLFKKISGTLRESDLKMIMDPVVIPMLRNHLNHNKEFLNTLKAIFSHQSKRKITSQHPNFTENDRRYHYLIPSISYSKLNLNSVVLTLANFQSLTMKKMTKDSPYIQILSANDVQGSLQVDHGIPNRNPIKLNFTTDIVISFDGESRRLSVEAQNYSFIQTSPKISTSSWLPKYSRVIIYVVEEALANNIMPSMEVWRISYSNLSTAYNLKISIKRMLEEIEQQFEEIDNTSNQQPSNISTSTERTNSTKIESYNYQILLDDMMIKLISDTPCDIEKIWRCLPENFEIHHKINVAPISKCNQTKPGSPIILNFYANFTSIKHTIDNQKKFQENTSCGLQISNNQDIKVVISPTDKGAGDQSNTKEKIDDSLLKTAKERLIVQTVKPKNYYCFPLAICNMYEKMVNDFFQSFIREVLKTSSFKTIT